MKNSVPDKIKLGISSCLLGNPVRYDGGHKLDYFLTDTLGRYVEWAPVCPEVECGLPVPREAMRLVGDPKNPRLVTVRTRVDHSARMAAWAKKKFVELEKEDICGFVFKNRSPSSGMRGVKIYRGRTAEPGSGSLPGPSWKSFLPPWKMRPGFDLISGDFIERIFVYRRWRDISRKTALSGAGLLSHETSLLMSTAEMYRSTEAGGCRETVRRDELHAIISGC
jgi:uncharacterized protein YbbK (DUF523 family)